MKPIQIGEDIRFRIALLVWVCITIGLYLRQTTPFGLGITPDTVSYVMAAEKILQGAVDVADGAFGVLHPPGFPTILSVTILATGLVPLAAAFVINGIAAATIVAVFMLGARRIPDTPVWLSGLIITFSLPLTAGSALALSESLFTMIAVLALGPAVARTRDAASAVALAVLVGAEFLVRYLGIVLLPVLCLQLLLFARVDRRRRVVVSSVYLGTATAIVALVLWRNHYASGTLFGPRFPSEVTFGENLNRVVSTTWGWFFPDIPWAGTICLLFLAGVAIALWVRRRVIASGLRKLPETTTVQALFVLAFWCALVASASRTAFDRIDTRLLSPVFPALAFTVLAIVSAADGSGPRRRRIPWARALLVVVLIAQPVRVVMKDTHRRGRDGAGGYNHTRWRNSHLLNDCVPRIAAGDDPVFSNQAPLLRMRLGIQARMSPVKFEFMTTVPTGIDSTSLFDRMPALDGAWLVWFDTDLRPEPYTIDELQRMCRLEKVVDCSDGAIYRVNRRIMPADR